MIKKMLKKIKKVGVIKMLLLINLYLFYILLFCNILINTKKQMVIILIISIILIFLYGLIGIIKNLIK